MAGKGVSPERLKTILERQARPSWGPDYEPSIKATKGEAPSPSWAKILRSGKFQREIHTHSIGEAVAALLGSYHPYTVGLQEHRMLSPTPCRHPLFNMPGVEGTGLPPLKGMIDVAERLGFLRELPIVRVPDPEKEGETMSAVFPYIGDQLWAVRGKTTSTYCVNWSIKKTVGDFGRRFSGTNRKRTKRSDQQEGELARHTMERVYYEDASIRTVHVTQEDIDEEVAANLHQLFLHHRRKLALNAEQRMALLERFRSAIQTGVPVTDVVLFFMTKEKVDRADGLSYFYQLVWQRKLRVDLFRPILVDKPLVPETRDVLDVYADWFKE